ncbi:MAG: large conductance mechanosensitive channel protein MscL [Actinobacteria bacterium]|nr:large conductance mechanosensitive channel protein MscL [Actinomycetota bacterium]
MLKEFRDFIMKGNLIEIAVAFIMALAFAAVVASFVADIVTPIIGAIFGQPDFSALKIDIGDGAITYGKFLNVVITFLIVAFVMFLVVKAYNRMTGPKAATTKGCPFCKTDIAIDATRCANCTSQLEGASA